MSNFQKSPYGSWKSPITSELITSKSLKLFDISIHDTQIYWTESRPSEGGRSVIVCQKENGEKQDLIPKNVNARSKVHEYGGLSYVVNGETLYFCNYEDQRIYKISPDEPPTPITPEGNYRYADLQFDKYRNRIICVCETHLDGTEAINNLVSINPDEETDVQIIVQGADFYGFPRISPDGTKLAFICWQHPNMPWDGTELWVADMDSAGNWGQPLMIAGGESESIFQPEWSPDNILYFASDRNGWWNLYRFDGEISPVIEMDAEFGLPFWVFGMSTYDFISKEKIACAYCEKGLWKLATIDLNTNKLETIDVTFSHIDYVRASSDKIVFRGSAPTQPNSIVAFHLENNNAEVLKSSADVLIDLDYISIPETVEFTNKHGESVYGFFYPPKNKNYEGLEENKPPLIVMSHGGPTGATSNSLSLKLQYWTSRGFAVLDVNYGGSTGYGRKYRERLNNRWGIVDVEDCVYGAKFLAEQGLVDSEKLIIRGSSAGGYTTLAALTFYDAFSAGASYYGISDIEALAKDTHKFEKHYTDTLIGKYPDEKETYQQRSPINFTEKLSCPIIFFQGMEDKVVPPSQAKKMVDALKVKGLPVAYITFDDESHGFRKAGNIKKALEAELYFYSRIFEFELAEDVEPIEIENLG